MNAIAAVAELLSASSRSLGAASSAGAAAIRFATARRRATPDAEALAISASANGNRQPRASGKRPEFGLAGGRWNASTKCHNTMIQNEKDQDIFFEFADLSGSLVRRTIVSAICATGFGKRLGMPVLRAVLP
jgi:hypothetical protein